MQESFGCENRAQEVLGRLYSLSVVNTPESVLENLHLVRPAEASSALTGTILYHLMSVLVTSLCLCSLTGWYDIHKLPQISFVMAVNASVILSLLDLPSVPAGESHLRPGLAGVLEVQYRVCR